MDKDISIRDLRLYGDWLLSSHCVTMSMNIHTQLRFEQSMVRVLN
jgi:hypothetical protein